MNTGKKNQIAICGDPHFGANLESDDFVEYQSNCFDKMIDECLSRGITSIKFLGDVFNSRTNINFKTLRLVKEKFKSAAKKMSVDMLLGNHDVFYKTTNDLNAPSIIFDDDIFDGEHFCNLNVITKPAEITINGVLCLFIPWMTKDNYEECMEYLENSTARYCFGHFEINGALMNSFVTCEKGLSKKLFKKFDRVFSGHFHTKSDMYIGSMTQLTWNDYGDPRGFWILDLNSGQTEFVQLGEEIFRKIVIGEKTKISEFSDVEKCYIKVYINRKLKKKEQDELSDLLMRNIKHEVIDNTIIEDNNDIVVEDESTETVIQETVNAQENLDDQEKADVIKLLLKTAYEVTYNGA